MEISGPSVGPGRQWHICSGLEADIAAGNRLGMETILVLTGNATAQDAADAAKLSPERTPGIVLDSVRDIIGNRFKNPG